MTTQFDNFAAEALADELGAIDEALKVMEARASALKAELKRRGLETAQGERFIVTRSDAVRWTLDSAAVKAAMGEEWANRHSKITPVTSFRVKAFHRAHALAA